MEESRAERFSGIPLGSGLSDRLQLITDAALAYLDLDELLDELLERLVHGRPEDDVALVAVRLHRQDRPRPAEAGPNSVPPNVPEDAAQA